MNLYAYVKGDPVNYTDPSGLKTIVVIGCKYGSGPSAPAGITGGVTFTSVGGPRPNDDIDRDGKPDEDIVVTATRPKPNLLCRGGASCTIQITNVPFWKWPAPATQPRKPPKVTAADFCGGGGVNLPEGSWSEACRKHDNCYDRSGTPREICDARFLKDLFKDCIAGVRNLGACGAVAISGYVVVRFGGGLMRLYKER